MKSPRSSGQTRAMRTEFRKALMPGELRSLCTFDRKVFPSDHFSPADWRGYEAWWLVVNQRKIGCCAFETQDDGCLYISTTGILPSFQRRGYGRLMKTWQLIYAREKGFQCVETHTRKSNVAMIALNKEFGFQVIRTERGYYEDPREKAVVMRLELQRPTG